MKTTGIIYKITNKINGKVYIGQTVQSLHKRKGQHLYRFKKANRDHMIYLAFKKYGVESFSWDVIETCEDIDELNEREIHYINEYDSYEHGYNMSLGGNTVSVETRKKLSEIFKGREITWMHRILKTRSENFKKGLHSLASPTGSKHSKSKKYIITEPNGTIHIVDGLRKWCRDWKKETLYHSGLISVAKGYWKHTKGYKCRYAEKESATIISQESRAKRLEAVSIQLHSG